MNVVMNDIGAYIELQGTAEGAMLFRPEELQAMLALASDGIKNSDAESARSARRLKMSKIVFG